MNTAKLLILLGSRLDKLVREGIAAAAADGGLLIFPGAQKNLAGFIFQDNLAATPAAASGAMAGYAKGRADNTYPATQATDANKPTLEMQSNGIYHFRFDGSNDFLSSSFPCPASAFTIIAGVDVVGVTTSQRITYGGAGAPSFEIVSSTFRQSKAGAGGSEIAAALPVGKSVISVVTTGSARTLRRNGAVVATDSSVLTYASAAAMTIGAISTGSAPLNGTMSGFYFSGGAISDVNRVPIERLLAFMLDWSYSA